MCCASLRALGFSWVSVGRADAQLYLSRCSDASAGKRIAGRGEGTCSATLGPFPYATARRAGARRLKRWMVPYSDTGGNGRRPSSA